MSAAMIACEQAPPPRPPSTAAKAPAAGATASQASDAAAIQSMLRDQGGKPARSGPAGSALPPGHPPLNASGAGSAAPPAGGGPAVGGKLSYDAPAAWKSVTPASTMRKAQFVIPRAEGDTEDGECIVFYFGKGEGGSVQGNLTRWRGQFTNPDGSPLPDDAGESSEFAAGELQVTLLDVSGRFAPGAMPGMPATGPKDNYRMLAAVVETPDGPWFFKATGPAATMAANAEALKAMLATVKPQP